MAKGSLRAGMVAARRAGAGGVGVGGAPGRGRGMGRRAARAAAVAADAPSAGASAAEESKTDRMERRARETSEVEMRVKSVADAEELMRELEGDQLVVLEVESDTLCELRDVERVSPAYFDQPEEVLMEPCGDFKHSFQRIARNCPDVKFLSFVGDASKETLSFAKERLGVGTFPTLQFYKVRGPDPGAPQVRSARVRCPADARPSNPRPRRRAAACSGSTRAWTTPCATSTRACSSTGTATRSRTTT